MSCEPSVRSRWLDIGQVLFCVFMDRDGVEVQYPALSDMAPAYINDMAPAYINDMAPAYISDLIEC